MIGSPDHTNYHSFNPWTQELKELAWYGTVEQAKTQVY